MKKWIFLVPVFFYIVGAILGLMGNAYTEIDSLEKSINQKLFSLIILSMIIGSVVFYFFKTIFPNGFDKQRKFVKFLLLILFLVLSFGLNRGWVQTLNTLGTKKHFFVDEYITSKDSEVSGKTRFYYLGCN